MKKLCLLLAFILLLTGCAPKDPTTAPSGSLPQQTKPGQSNPPEDESNMEMAEKEFNQMLEDLKSFPVNFVYNKVQYKGFDPQYFTEVSHKTSTDGTKRLETIVLSLEETLTVTLEAAYYRGYEAWDYTVYFENTSKNENSGILECVNAIDMEIAGKDAVLKGILGDHGNQYAPYNYDLTAEPVNFTSLAGRATHHYFPYFNLENENGGALFAIGWGGTWQADFTYDEAVGSTRFVGTGTVGMSTYLKPGEVVRTPLIAKVAYYERDEAAAMNIWRRWMVECNLPSTDAQSEGPLAPFSSVMLAYDTGRPNSDGSISEGYDTWKQSIDAYYDHGLTADFRWLDAGWYFDPYGKTVPTDWWGTVGTWDLDTTKWPEGSLLESTTYMREHGTKTFMWFEPERVTHLDGMVANYGYKREWVLSDHGNNNCYLNNLGNAECLAWTLERIITVMDENGIDMYREDFNMDPSIFWSIGDGYEGENRTGITENLYMQGHYALWDGIISYCAENGKCTFVDSCASGGGRNDLETLRRAVPLLRSDSDRTTTELRLAMTTRLVQWIPFTGAVAKESAGQLTNGLVDIYVLRASYLPHYSYQDAYYHNQDTIDWDVLKKGMGEWKEVSKYFYKDFYVLTPQQGVGDTENWTAYEYFDPETDSGVVQAFRKQNCPDSTYMLQFKGVDPDRYYTVRDLDGVNTMAKIKGSMLLKGIPLAAENPRTAIMLFIEPCT